MSLRNEVMLITYADSLGGSLRELAKLLEDHFSGAIGGVHILPFYPSTADRGFAPICYDEVDPAFGSWSDIEGIAERYDLMADFMINHISRGSRYFQDFLDRGDESPYSRMFIRYRDFWPDGEPTAEQVAVIYKRKPRAPYTEVVFRDGTSEKVWCTFDGEQIDLDLNHEVAREFVRETLIGLADRGVKAIRLDAFAYAVKKANTSCFFVEPEIWELLGWVQEALSLREVEILPEIHEHYSLQQKIADHGYAVYDFVLPMVLLHTLTTGNNRRLLQWLRICPRKQFTTLDTHDGIGVVDAKDLLTDREIEVVQEHLFSQRANVKRVYNTAAYNNLDIYQINCTYYSALGADDDAYILARAIQFFTPGIPQVYYVGLLAGENDIELVERTKTGRDINRHVYTSEEVRGNIERPVVQRLINLMRFRSSHPAFSGELRIDESGDESGLRLSWTNGRDFASLEADLRERRFSIEHSDPRNGRRVELSGV